MYNEMEQHIRGMRPKVERNEKIVEMRDRGLTWKEIGEEHKIHFVTASQIYHRTKKREKLKKKLAKKRGLLED
jgi:orotate phosphoribosyltransferase-like protein